MLKIVNRSDNYAQIYPRTINVKSWDFSASIKRFPLSFTFLFHLKLSSIDHRNTISASACYYSLTLKPAFTITVLDYHLPCEVFLCNSLHLMFSLPLLCKVICRLRPFLNFSNFGRLLYPVCLSIQAVTFEGLNHKLSSLVRWYILTIPRSSLSTKVIGSMSVW